MADPAEHDGLDLAELNPSPEVYQQLLAFLRKNNMTQTEEIFAKEVGLAGSGQSGAFTNENVASDFASFIKNVEGAYDVLQAELSLFLYPVFVHSYLRLLGDVSPVAAKQFFERFRCRIPRAYEEPLIQLSRITTKEQAQESELVQMYRASPFVIRISKVCNTQLEHCLQRNATLRVVTKHNIALETSDAVPKNKNSIEWQMGGLLGHAAFKDPKKYRVFYGVSREDSPYCDKKRMRAKESKDKKRDVMVPAADRIPLPMNEWLRYERSLMVKEETGRSTYVGVDNPPSICFFTALNTDGGVASCDVSDDSLIVALGLSDSNIALYAIDETKQLKRLKEVDELTQIDVPELEPDMVREMLYDETSASRYVNMAGHTGPVYAVNFDPTRRLLVSSGADATVRLWSVDTFQNVTVNRLSRPVWDVRFCSRGYYYCTGGADKTATVWSTDRVHPLRIFPDCYGHVTCIDYHPNCNYIAGGSDDRYVRLWDVLTGTCVRAFGGHKAGIRGIKISPCGRYIVTVSGDGNLCVWDIASQRLLAAETHAFPCTMATISFTREGDTFSVSRGNSAITIYSLESLLRQHSQQENLSHEPKINPEHFQIYEYATKNTPVVGLHWTRRNLLLGVGSFMQ